MCPVRDSDSGLFILCPVRDSDSGLFILCPVRDSDSGLFIFLTEILIWSYSVTVFSQVYWPSYWT